MEGITKNKELIYNGFITVEKIDDKEIVKVRNGVGAIIYDTVKNKYIFIEQYREPVEGKMVEICAGKIDEGEDDIEAIKREVIEETGYKCDKITPLTQFYVSPGYSTEVISLFYVEVSERISDGGGIEDEDIKIIEVDKLGFGGNIFLGEEEGMLSTPYQLIDAKSILAVNFIEHNKVMKDVVNILTDSRLRSI
jgi:ADP-ribose pyrophosphatase